MHIKMHVRTYKLAKFFRGCIHVPRFNRGGSEKGEDQGRKKERRWKGKVEGMTEGRGGGKAWGIRMGGGNCATAPRWDRRHWQWAMLNCKKTGVQRPRRSLHSPNASILVKHLVR